MTFRDLLITSVENLWLRKLRAFLTIAGVVIAIAAFVAMLSFGAGNQRRVAEEYDKLGLFTTMQVYPPSGDSIPDSQPPPILDQAAVEMLAGIPGVNLAYPYKSFTVKAVFEGTEITTEAQVLSAGAARTRLYSQLVAGDPIPDDTIGYVLVTERLLTLLGVDEADSVIGRPLEVAVERMILDSGLVSVIKDEDGSVRRRLEAIKIDSLSNAEYVRQVIRREAGDAIKRFLNGFVNASAKISDTLIISGVLRQQYGRRLITKPIILPPEAGLEFTSRGMSTDLTEALAAIKSGQAFSFESGEGQSYPHVTLDLDPSVSYQVVRDSVKALGYNTFSFAEQFDQIRQFFFYFNMGLGMLGLIALVTASLGIVNTMVMSIIERTREIGILKSLGADDRDIRLLFLMESGMIGLIGGAAGIFVGWLISRGASLAARLLMERQGLEGMEFFATPPWLIAIALLFGLTASLAAGYYPAARAAKVPPVEALRNE